MTTRQALSVLVCMGIALLGAASDAQFVLYGGNLMGASYYYQLQLANGTVILEMRDGDVLKTRADLDTTIKEVQQLASKDSSWKDITDSDGNLMSDAGAIIGRLNCQFKAWTCEADKAMVVKHVDAEIVDHTYVGHEDPRFQLTKSTFGAAEAYYTFDLRVKESSLITSPRFDTVELAKSSISAIQAGSYAWSTVRGNIQSQDVLKDSAGHILAIAIRQTGITLDDSKAYVKKYAPVARIDDGESSAQHIIV